MFAFLSSSRFVIATPLSFRRKAAAAVTAATVLASYATKTSFAKVEQSDDIKSITLYQYAVCPYCNKAQTFLEAKGIPHKRVEVNPLSKKEMKFSTYRKVPFLVYETSAGEKIQVNDSDEIIDWTEKLVGESADTSDEMKKWRQWTNERLVKLLPPNIYRTPSESIQAFDYIAKSSNFSAFERFSATYAGALIMYIIAKRSLKMYNINDPREDLALALEHWAANGLQEGQAFHGGNIPDKADFAVYGVVRSIEGNYMTWEDMKARVSPRFWTWYANVKARIPKPQLV